MADSGITCCLGPVYRENPDFWGRKTLESGKGLDKTDRSDEDVFTKGLRSKVYGVR